MLVLHGLDYARHIGADGGPAGAGFAAPGTQPRRGPWRDVSGHLYRMGATALPITALVGF